VNLSLSSGYSTITWFVAGYFFGGEVVLHCFVFTYALFHLAFLLALVLQILQFCINNEATKHISRIALLSRSLSIIFN
jgi:hypothetical protein